MIARLGEATWDKAPAMLRPARRRALGGVTIDKAYLSTPEYSAFLFPV
jgi:hypothetical protein